MPARRIKQNDVNEEIYPRGGHVPQAEQVPQGVQDDQVPIMEGGNEVLVGSPGNG